MLGSATTHANVAGHILFFGKVKQMVVWLFAPIEPTLDIFLSLLTGLADIVLKVDLQAFDAG